ncbi:trimeric intracellular cation channel family protein [Lacihabitans sp. LS3-19]|uniref:trimeric intracellular cation channel family protein n=1 Tax=Lacihabitans sp. LS3-19 TaxID=2487335 RepID=UPI0020CFA8D6|nr:trimeric intracellular cation channel family protein [Lacihabitans sp. LS3-19]MCP9767249.1 trimeric intracellular cation channel family protein [Lacihabitans sp. LS3-19]
MELISFITIGGTISFAASGALAGIRKELDIFGVTVIAFVTAIGGGTIRDLLLGHFPVKWLTDFQIILLIMVVSVLTVIFRKKIEKLDKTLLFFDTLGLGFFTLKGIEAGLAAELSVLSCLILATITACFGGVIRDIILNEIPALFQKEIYATACIIGGILFFILKRFHLDNQNTQFIVFVVIVLIRFLAIKFNFSLPKIKNSI